MESLICDHLLWSVYIEEYSSGQLVTFLMNHLAYDT